MTRRFLVRLLALLVLLWSTPAVAEEPEAETPEEEEGTEGEAPPSEEPEEEKDELLDDLCSPWFHVAGGGGVILSQLPGKPLAAGRVSVGVGFYVPMLYVSGGLDYTPSEAMPLVFDGWAAVGAAIPVPVFHPLIGFKVGGGVHWSSHGWGTQLVYGPQVGWIVRGLNKKVGFRAVIEPAVRWYPETSYGVPEVILTLGLVL